MLPLSRPLSLRCSISGNHLKTCSLVCRENKGAGGDFSSQCSGLIGHFPASGSMTDKTLYFIGFIGYSIKSGWICTGWRDDVLELVKHLELYNFKKIMGLLSIMCSNLGFFLSNAWKKCVYLQNGVHSIQQLCLEAEPQNQTSAWMPVCPQTVFFITGLILSIKVRHCEESRCEA